ncbi:anti-sigma regulatory factor (Ser/Thr protein kinase) [Pseudonocardia sediminis]|uniref:Anti-sigma regulatory factor (Ser/Thr protein kinase) n=1 Tax=Pseudonocardia sediminis TaxID=1397368 RepID=A0A4Q7UXI7_PSEST|nr:ATP-binding protein [Pseudonocardia sediminis]RZT86495.1 anti-sigma regulatory factor (Ser/Thr protein kinase) [Pseudonocardia sediminis]
MRVNEAAAPRFAHGLVSHDGPADFVGRVAPLAEAALSRGDQVTLAVSPASEELLRDRLGGERVSTLTALAPAARGSGQTVAAWRARELRALCSAGRDVFVVTEHDAALDGPDGSYWTELEAALNISLGGLPVTQVCGYPQIPLHQVVADAALVNHPLLLRAGELMHNPEHRSPAQVMANLPVAPPELLGPPDVFLRYNTFELARVRDAVEDAVRGSELERTRGEDLVLAVNEIATNAVEHGSSQAELFLWAGPDELVCELHDEGRLEQPLIGLAPPHPSQARGRGTWIARQLCDALHVWRDSGGTHVRLLARA